MLGTPATFDAPLDVVLRPKRTILVVDDDVDQVVVLTDRLQRQGFEVLAAHRGQDGIDAAKDQLPDLVLLDLRLPDVEGLDVCRSLSDDPATCDIPVIILSGLERHDIVRSSRSAGCHFFMRKPYDPNALLVLIERTLEEIDNWDGY